MMAGARASTKISNFWLLMLLLVVSSATNMDRAITVLVLEPLRLEFGLSDMWIGLISGGPFAVIYSLASIPLARIADRGSHKAILSGCFAIWIVTMALCGCATSAMWLLVARMGVGVGEAGVIPTSHAILGSSIPKKEQGSAFSIYSLSTILGAPLAYTFGGWLVAHHGWRSLYIAAAAISVPAMLATLLFLPKSHPVAATIETSKIDASEKAVIMQSNSRALCWVAAGCTSYSFYTYGPLGFIAAYMLRYTGINLTVLGGALGILTTVASLAGVMAGSSLARRFTQHNQRWLIYLPAIGLFASFPLTIMTFITNSSLISLLGIALISTFLFATYPPIYAAIQVLADPKKRTITIAAVLSISNLVGMLFGPLFTGFCSDLFKGAAGHNSLRISIIAVSSELLIGAAAFLLVARSLPVGPTSGPADIVQNPDRCDCGA